MGQVFLPNYNNPARTILHEMRLEAQLDTIFSVVDDEPESKCLSASNSGGVSLRSGRFIMNLRCRLQPRLNASKAIARLIAVLTCPYINMPGIAALRFC